MLPGANGPVACVVMPSLRMALVSSKSAAYARACRALMLSNGGFDSFSMM